MKKLLLILSATLLPGLFAVSCSDGDEPEVIEAPKDIELTEGERQAMTKIGEFDLNLLEKVCESTPDENVVISPFGTSVILTLLANQNNALKQQVPALFGFSTLDELIDYNSKLLKLLPTLDKNAKLDIANSQWYNPYKSEASELFGLEAFGRNIPDDASVWSEMDEWISNKTNGKINKLPIESESSLEEAFLTSISFKNDWTVGFKKESTTRVLFYGRNGISDAYMMYAKDGCKMTRGKYCMAAIYDYGNGAFQALFVMPYAQEIEKEALHSIPELRFKTRAFFDLPRFSLNQSKSNFYEILKNMGLTALSAESQNKFEVYQSATATFEEDGGDAPTVTHGSDSEGCHLIDMITFDKPFYFFIKEKSTGTTLIAGKIIGF